MFERYLKYLFMILLGIVYAYADINFRVYMGNFDFLYIYSNDTSNSTYLVKMMYLFIPSIFSSLIIAIAASGIYVFVLKGSFNPKLLLPVLSYIFIYYVNGIKFQAFELIELSISVSLFLGTLPIWFFLKKKNQRIRLG